MFGELALPRICTVPDTVPPEGELIATVAPARAGLAGAVEAVAAGCTVGGGAGAFTGLSSTNSAGVFASAGRPVRRSMAWAPAGAGSDAGPLLGFNPVVVSGLATQSLAHVPTRPGPLANERPDAFESRLEGKLGAFTQVPLRVTDAGGVVGVWGRPLYASNIASRMARNEIEVLKMFTIGELSELPAHTPTTKSFV
jgi:hypothetical protein